MEFNSLSYLILALPFAMFLIIGLLGYKMSPKVAGLLGTTVFGVTSIICYGVAIQYFSQYYGGEYPKEVLF